jgi:hypothetical protein
MKRFIIALCVLACAFSAQAASTITPSIVYESPSVVVLKLHCVSHTDGSFTASTAIPLTPWNYTTGGWKLKHAYATNGASGYPDTSGTVTITDATGQQIIGSTAGDTLTLSTSASATALLVIDRASSQRPASFQYYVTISDTQSGTATSVFDIYLVFGL